MDSRFHSSRNTSEIELQQRTTLPATAHGTLAGYQPVSQPNDDPEIMERNGDFSRKLNKFSITSLDDWWVLEIIALVSSAGLLVAVAVLLARYDDRPQPDWRFISLNTMVSWLGTLSRALVLLPVARSLGQLKWTWFAAQPRTISDLRSFDAASRGVIGSAQLLSTNRGWHLQSIGCVATILAIGFGPFLQNLIHYYPKVVVDQAQRAYITNSSSISAVGPLIGGSTFLVDPVLKANVYNSIFNSDPNQPWATPQYSCSTGNCTFDPIVTIAARARCSNLTDLLHTSCSVTSCGGSTCTENCTVSIGQPEQGGMSLSYRMGKGGEYLKVSTTNNLSTPHAVHAPMSGLPVIQYITVKDFNKILGDYDWNYIAWTNTPFRAMECEINMGVLAVQDSIENVLFKSEEIGFWQYGSPHMSFTPNATLLAWWHDLAKPWDSLALDDLSVTYGLALPPGFDYLLESIKGTNTFVGTLFDGSYHASREVTNWYSGNALSYATVDTTQSIFYGNFSGCEETDDHLSCGVRNVAKAMTKSFRDSAYITNGLESANVTYGQTLVTVSYVRIDWAWLSLPLCIWIMAAVLWIGTALKTRRARVPAWANNILPLLFLYQRHGDQEGGESQGMSNADYLRRAGRINAQLRISNGKAKLE